MKKAIIHYYDIGDYKSREEKLENHQTIWLHRQYSMDGTPSQRAW
jgi:predicted helicase